MKYPQSSVWEKRKTLTTAFSFPSRLRYYQESAFPSQSFHWELPIGGDRVVPTQEEAADSKPPDPAQPERALCGCQRPGHQDPTQEVQLPQEQRVSVYTPTNTINLNGNSQICTQSHKVPFFIRCFFICECQACVYVRSVC